MKRTLTAEEASHLRRLLSEAGWSSAFRCTPLTGGANNRVYRIDGDDRRAVLKVYFRSADDPRDRLGAEVAFATFLREQGIAAAPGVLAWDRDQGMALFEFVPGRKLAPQEVSTRHVDAALRFVCEANRRRTTLAACALPAASEACFSFAEHLRCIERRVRRLDEIEDGPGGSAPAAIGQRRNAERTTGRQARAFVERELAPAWRRIASRLERQIADHALAHDALLAPEERCLSPSDFGFHNALLDAEERLWFVDFEYAGWDDPAKLVCDFYCQVQAPAPAPTFASFVNGVASLFADPASVRRRVAWLLPAYRIKWCCILLNDFLPAGAQRRRFRRQTLGEGRRASQLAKARAMLQLTDPGL